MIDRVKCRCHVWGGSPHSPSSQGINVRLRDKAVMSVNIFLVAEIGAFFFLLWFLPGAWKDEIVCIVCIVLVGSRGLMVGVLICFLLFSSSPKDRNLLLFCGGFLRI
jgi:hypothetical protein